jgi:hypothetical protein
MQAAGSEVPAVASSSHSSRAAAHQLDEAPTAPLDCVLSVARVTKTLAQRDSSCSGSSCSCASVPRLIHHLEQQAQCDAWVVKVSALGMHDRLVKLAAALLKGNHSARAFRRTTELTDW